MKYADRILQALGRSSDTYSDLEKDALNGHGTRNGKARDIFYEEVQILRRMGFVCINSVKLQGMPLRLTPKGRSYLLMHEQGDA